jgi:hypothetical protein
MGRSANATVRSGVVGEHLPEVNHDTAQFSINRVEADHGRLKTRLRSMRGLTNAATPRPTHRGPAPEHNSATMTDPDDVACERPKF